MCLYHRPIPGSSRLKLIVIIVTAVIMSMMSKFSKPLKGDAKAT